MVGKNVALCLHCGTGGSGYLVGVRGSQVEVLK